MESEEHDIPIFQQPHRWDIRSKKGYKPLTIRRAGREFFKVKLHESVIKGLREAGFYQLYRLSYMTINSGLISALVERWRQETHSFHFRFGEATITLQDVQILTGLRVDGDAVTGEILNKKDAIALCEELLGRELPMKAGLQVSMKQLLEIFEDPPRAEASEKDVLCKTRAVIMYLIGTFVMPNKNVLTVSIHPLLLLKDLGKCSKFAWGAATLAFLYRQLCKATKPKAASIAGCLPLVQMWAWERLGCIRPVINEWEKMLPDDPRGRRWANKVDKRELPVLRKLIDEMTEKQMMWEPYTEDDFKKVLPNCDNPLPGVWCARVPLICYELVEEHLPDRVLRQFGRRQRPPSKCDTGRHLHDLKQNSQKTQHWFDYHATYIEKWNKRAEHIFPGVPCSAQMGYMDEYMVWYRTITRQFIEPETPESHPPPVAAEMLVDPISRIHQIVMQELGVDSRWDDPLVLALQKVKGICENTIPTLQTCIFDGSSHATSQDMLSCATPTPPAMPTAPPPPPRITIPCTLDREWVMNLMHGLDWSSRNLHPSQFPSVLPVEVFDIVVLSASKIFEKEINCVKIDHVGDASKVVVVGDLHGQYHDLVFLLGDAGYPGENRSYVFNGDYVDRGAWGLETFLLLLAWKVLLPHKVFLLRGNHESESCTRLYGFEKEVLVKYGNDVTGKYVYQRCLECFKKLPLASIIADRVYTTHGGLFRSQSFPPPEKRTREKSGRIASPLTLGSLEELSEVQRFYPDAWDDADPSKHLVLSDVMWSDPSASLGLSENTFRGVGLLWGPDCTEEFLKKSKLKIIIRSHEGPDARARRTGMGRMDLGYTIDHDGDSGKLITLFSAPDYPQFQESGERYNNKGAYIVLEPPHFDSPVFHCFDAVTPRPKAYQYDDDCNPDSDKEPESTEMTQRKQRKKTTKANSSSKRRKLRK